MIEGALKILSQLARSSRKPDVLLHIGAPKCGSSAIQKFCTVHRADLLKYGYYYPEHALDVNGISAGHAELAGHLLKGDQAQARVTFQRWLAEAEQHRACLLLSSEGFYEKSTEFAELCRGLNVRVLSFLRNPLEALLSNYNQAVKRHMAGRRLGEMLPEILAGSTGYLVGQPLLHWGDAFGDQNCCFNPYRAPGSGGTPIEGQFIDLLGMRAVAGKWLGKAPGQVNRSYVKSALELKRLLNIVLQELPEAHAHRVDWCLQAYSDQTSSESSYGIGDLDRDVLSRVQAQLLPPLKAVMERFPALKPIAEQDAMVSASPERGSLDLFSPLRRLESELPDVCVEIRRRAAVIRDRGRRDYPFFKLLDLLGVEFDESSFAESQSGLTESQRQILRQEGIESADCLREMAQVFERQDLMDDALFAIGRALDLRPAGVGIQKIKARIESKLKSSQPESAAGPAPGPTSTS